MPGNDEEMLQCLTCRPVEIMSVWFEIMSIRYWAMSIGENNVLHRKQRNSLVW